jgi:hypothetical protein
MNPIPCRAQCRAKTVLRGVAAVLFLAVSASVAAQQASASLRVSVVIPPRVKVVVEAPQQLEVTVQDVARGYVEVRTPTAISVQSSPGCVSKAIRRRSCRARAAPSRCSGMRLVVQAHNA